MQGHAAGLGRFLARAALVATGKASRLAGCVLDGSGAPADLGSVLLIGQGDSAPAGGRREVAVEGKTADADTLDRALREAGWKSERLAA